jgi:hypothetical protein
MKFFTKALAAISVCLSLSAQAQSLPAGSIGSVVNPTANNNVQYTFTFTPGTTGSDYIGFAFRQDPAFWNFTNVSLTTGGGSNLLVNGNLANGGPVQVTTNNGTQTIQAPANWGVWYQNGTYPAAAGSWSSGQWYDGAVGSYDGIYQGVNLTSGVTYSISFYALSTYQASTNDQAMIGVYAGPCTSLTLAASACVPLGSSFTPIAVPGQTVNAGNPSAPPVAPSAPTVVSTAPGTPIVTTGDIVYGTPTSTTTNTPGQTSVATSVGYTTQRQTATLGVTQTTTQVATTPITTVVVQTTPWTQSVTTTPVTVTTWSDGSTTTTNGTPVNSTNSGNLIVTTTTVGDQVVTATENQQFSTRIDMYNELKTTNSQVNSAMNSDPLSRTKAEGGRLTLRNGKETDFYITGIGAQTNTVNSYSSKTGIGGFGVDHIVDPTLLIGFQYNHGYTTMSGDQAGGSLSKDMVGLYAVKSINDWLLKGDLGVAFNQYTSYHTLNALGAGNNSSTSGNDQWLALRGYTPDMYGFRPFVGGRAERNQINGVSEQGTALTAVSYNGVNSRTYTGEAGVAYYKHFTNKWSLGAEVSQDTQNVKNIMGSVSYKTTDTSSILLKVGTQLQYQTVNDYAQAYFRIVF